MRGMRLTELGARSLGLAHSHTTVALSILDISLSMGDSVHDDAMSQRRNRTARPPWKLIRIPLIVCLSLLSNVEAFSVQFRPCLKCSKFRPVAPCCALTGPSWSAIVDDPAADTTSTAPSALGLYVHIPYCRRRCRYCDFAIVPIGTPSSALVEDESNSAMTDRATRGFLEMDATYRFVIVNEIGLIASFARKATVPLRSIYFGGGTPSLAPTETLEAILSAVLTGGMFELEPDAEISIEMDPGTFSLSKLKSIQEMGFNRVSLGVQSFDDDVLESIGRFHRQKDILESVSLLDKVFGEDINYSIDLISGLPGVSLAKWAETLEMATSLSPKPVHLSLYDLQVESGTVFGRWYGDQEESRSSGLCGTRPVAAAPLPSMDECAFAYKYASGYLREKGYEHYEISSYAYVGKDSEGPSANRSRHNQIYWEPGGQWFAVGLGATSSIARKRYTRPRTMADYVQWVDNQVATSRPAFLQDADANHEIDFDMLADIVMTRMRTSDGLDLDWIEKNAPNGQEAVKLILKGAQLGLELNFVELVRSKESSSQGLLRAIDPNGFLFSNSIISSIFAELGVED